MSYHNPYQYDDEAFWLLVGAIIVVVAIHGRAWL